MWNLAKKIIKNQGGFTHLYTVLIGISVTIALVGGLIVGSILLPAVSGTHGKTIEAVNNIISSGF